MKATFRFKAFCTVCINYTSKTDSLKILLPKSLDHKDMKFGPIDD